MQEVACENCAGIGTFDGDPNLVCPVCGGDGLDWRSAGEEPLDPAFPPEHEWAFD